MKSFEFLREADDTDRYNMYTIQRGDTLGKLASRFDTTVDGLMWLNPQITNRDLIITGNTLRIPKKGSSSPVQPTPKPKPAPKSAEVDSNDISEEERAWLNMIASKEASQGSYDSINFEARKLMKAGRLEKSGRPGEHPFSQGFKVDGKEVEDPKKRFTASGRYQMVWSTWKQAAELAGVDPRDFSPKNQDRAAIALAKYEYQRKFHRDLFADLKDSKLVPQAIQGSTGPWSKAAGGAGFTGDDYVAALDNLDRQTAEPKKNKP
jgi:murein DD-endopeptidase MepM/ murein hydrolase activator NlpD